MANLVPSECVPWSIVNSSPARTGRLVAIS
jgi:hypothetical protein